MFARRQINHQSTLKRRSAYSEAGTEIKSEKTVAQEDDADAQSMLDSSAPVGHPGPAATKRSGWFKFGGK